MSVWLTKLGIRPERMHRTLKEATASPPKSNMVEQQKTFAQFMQEYNQERPHEALGQKTPISFYRPSSRTYPLKVPRVEYNNDVIVRIARHNGEIKWRGGFVYISQTLVGEPIGLQQIDEHLWEVKFSYYTLGHLNSLSRKVKAAYIDSKRKVLPMSPV